MTYVLSHPVYHSPQTTCLHPVLYCASHLHLSPAVYVKPNVQRAQDAFPGISGPPSSSTACEGKRIAPRREHTSKALRYGTRSQVISQFYLHIPSSSANGINHTCLFLPSRSWYSFTDPGLSRRDGRLSWPCGVHCSACLEMLS